MKNVIFFGYAVCRRHYVEKEDKIVLNKYEALTSTVERLGPEVMNLKEEGGSTASTVALLFKDTVGA